MPIRPDQAIGASRPLYSATSFNSRPGLTFDGSDDELTYAGVGVFPVAANPCEIWALVNQTALAADNSQRHITCYGGAQTGIRRAAIRAVSNGANQARAEIGNGTTGDVATSPGDFSGVNVVRVVSGSTQAQASRNGNAGSAVSSVPAIGTTRTRIGATSATTAANFFSGVISFIAITAQLSSDDAAKMLTYLKARGGIA